MNHIDAIPDARSVFATRKPVERAWLLRGFRQQRGWSQEQLGNLAGLSQKTIERAEKTGRAGHDTWVALGHVFRRPELFNKVQFPNFADETKDEIPLYDPIAHANIEPGCGHRARLNRHQPELLEHAALAGWTIVWGNEVGDLIIRRDLRGLLREEDKLALNEELLKCFEQIGFA
jgi:transcriptional regulator with XRE-family HTH domain